MNCPICSNTHLQFTESVDELYSFSCPKCHGSWFRLNDYLKWLNVTNKSEYDLFIKNDLGNLKATSQNSSVHQRPDAEYLTACSVDQPFTMENLIEEYAKGNKNSKTSADELFMDIETKTSTQAPPIDNSGFVTIVDSKKAKLCPDCGRILIKYKVNNILNFSIEHCGTCSGVWFDTKKWDILSKYKLNDKVYRFFTEPWQRRIREEATKSYLDRKYNSKFGQTDYERIKSIKAWLDTNNNRREIIAYLLKNDPYKIS